MTRKGAKEDLTREVNSVRQVCRKKRCSILSYGFLAYCPELRGMRLRKVHTIL